ncbi:hypothetical protein BBJ29_003884 [Phytophthora kernoviae]|uniref:Parkin co-regulated protein n=1 Tax=Phytophthora kernoviae TaxID=325452 RepID=A0A421FQI8_9STRA|nr:hypothetical protein BBJ29_003884 [Phytophthora kernoviae]
MNRELAPLSTSPKSTVPGPQPRQRNVGVLEVKMKHRLQEDQSAVAVGILHRSGKVKEGGKGGGKAGLRWTTSMDDLDFSKYFPLFVDGMREKFYPFSFLAHEGAFQLAGFAQRHPSKLTDCLHRAISALRTNLETRDISAVRGALLLLQQLTQVAGVGPLLVPYYRQLLPVLNVFKSKRRNIGDAMDFQQQRAQDLGEVVLETLELLERTGGADAFINIKYMVPTYESALG